MLIFDIVTIVSIGLLIGTELAVSVFINPVLARLDDRTRAQAIQMFAIRLGKAMPVWYVANFVLVLTLTWLQRHQPSQSLLITSSVIWAVVILLTILFLVPINNRMMRLDPNSFTETQQREHRRWTTGHPPARARAMRRNALPSCRHPADVKPLALQLQIRRPQLPGSRIPHHHPYPRCPRRHRELHISRNHRAHIHLTYTTQYSLTMFQQNRFIPDRIF
jgi:uncharacterized membrane protein